MLFSAHVKRLDSVFRLTTHADSAPVVREAQEVELLPPRWFRRLFFAEADQPRLHLAAKNTGADAGVFSEDAGEVFRVLDPYKLSNMRDREIFSHQKLRCRPCSDPVHVLNGRPGKLTSKEPVKV